MRSASVCLIVLLCSLLLSAFPVAAKDGVHANVHSSIPAHARAGSQLNITWTLSNEEDGEPFNACRVFIRLIGPSGDSTEAFAPCGADGRYSALAEIPKGGVSAIQIGVAGTMSDQEGNSERSDWLMALANDPIEK